jgi:hypothetical protein
MSYLTGQYAAHAQQVLQDDRAYRPANTGRAYDKRTEEFIQFCIAKHSDMDPPYDNPTLVTEEKLFGFLIRSNDGQ